MNKILRNTALILLFSVTACKDDFLDITPRDSITDEAVWSTANGVMQYVTDVYNNLNGPLYDFTNLDASWMLDNFMTDDLVRNLASWNLLDFTASNAPIDRWSASYTKIRKTNLGIEKVGESTVLLPEDRDRYLGDLHFLRGMFYLELFRYYGKVPIITKALDRNTDDVFYERSSEKEVLEFIAGEFQTAAGLLPRDIPDSETGRATKGAAIGMEAITYLFGAGVVDAQYYENAAETADILINGDLKGKYSLFETGATPREKYANLFLEEYENNSEVLFDIQYAYPYKTTGFQTMVAPPAPGPGNDYGWGRNFPTQEIVDAYEMKDGSSFNWNNAGEAANPYANRDERFYASILYNDIPWKGQQLMTSSNIWSNSANAFVQNAPNGLWNTTATNATISGYYMRKHSNEPVICGYDNRGRGIGGGHNLIVLRYAEILLTYAEAKNEVSGPDASVYDAVDAVRRRAGQPDLPDGLGKDQMRERIRHERRIELAFENKRYFDIIRWHIGEETLNGSVHGMNIIYKKDPDGEVVPTYNIFKVVDKAFSAAKNYWLPVPQSAMDKNPKLAPNNPGW